MALGFGPVLPLGLDPRGEMIVSGNQDLLQSALQAIFGTWAGERPMEKDFCSTIPVILHYNFDNNIATIAAVLVQKELEIFEDRIIASTITVTKRKEQQEEIEIRVDYIEKETGVPGTATVTI